MPVTSQGKREGKWKQGSSVRSRKPAKCRNGGVPEVDRQTEHMLFCSFFHLLLLLLLLLPLLLIRLVMWVVWVINEFMFNLNLDQLAWATGSAIAWRGLPIFLLVCHRVSPLPHPSLLILLHVILATNYQEGLSPFAQKPKEPKAA